jgi:hypothetical protein
MSWQEELNEKRLATPGWYGCIAPDGWKRIVEETDAKLAYLDPKYKITQIKEKFGTLRYYYETSKRSQLVWEIMNAVVREAERESATTCEVCGNSSSRSIQSKGVKFDPTAVLKVSGGQYGWYKVICDSCDLEGIYKPLEKDEE